MSFSSIQKDEIIRQKLKASCCKIAILNGILATKAILVDKEVKISVSDSKIADFITKLILDLYGKEARLSRSKLGGRAIILTFSSPSAIKYLQGFKTQPLPFSPKCEFCKNNFFKGVFLASGRVSDPEKQFLLEFSTENYEFLLKLFSDFDFPAKYVKRKRENIVYFKKSSLIEDFFALAGMNTTAFNFINAKIENEIRNNVNRIANCETNNIDKAVTASQSHVSFIKELDQKGLLSSLPEELEKTARLRLKYEDLSLSALSKVAIPPISKSGLSHRLNKITELGQSLIKK